MKVILSKFLYMVIKITGMCIMRIFFSLKVEGRGNLPRSGSFIIAANHTSFLDPMAVQAALPVKVSWIVRKDVSEKRYLKFMHYIFDSIPVNGSVEKALVSLKKGHVLGIFPEGKRSNDGRLKEAGDGTEIVALRSGRPVVPVGIKGAFEAYPPGKRFFKPHPISVRIGRPIFFNKEEKEEIGELLLKETKDRVMDGIRTLIV